MITALDHLHGRRALKVCETLLKRRAVEGAAAHDNAGATFATALLGFLSMTCSTGKPRLVLATSLAERRFMLFVFDRRLAVLSFEGDGVAIVTALEMLSIALPAPGRRSAPAGPASTTA